MRIVILAMTCVLASTAFAAETMPFTDQDLYRTLVISTHSLAETLDVCSDGKTVAPCRLTNAVQPSQNKDLDVTVKMEMNPGAVVSGAGRLPKSGILSPLIVDGKNLYIISSSAENNKNISWILKTYEDPEEEEAEEDEADFSSLVFVGAAINSCTSSSKDGVVAVLDKEDLSTAVKVMENGQLCSP